MTFPKKSLLALSWLAAHLLVGRGFALAQVVPVPVSVTPVGATPVSLVQGGRYTFEFPPPPIRADGLKAFDLVSAAPSVTVTQLPTGNSGEVRREVQVSEDAPLGEAEMQVITDRGEQNVPVIVVPPPPPPNGEGPDGDDSGDTAADRPKDTGTRDLWWWPLLFVAGLVVGLVVRRRS
jgi:hypothetical protein